MTEGAATTENSDKAKEESTIFTFPARLRAETDNGAAHIRFKVIDKNETGPTVHLFMPLGVNVPDAAAYTTMDLGLVGGGESFLKNAAAGDAAVQSSDMIAAGATAGGIAATKFGDSLGVGALTGGTAQLRAGVASNPYTETQYTGSNIRSFGFTFKLVSESAAEADTALAIENFFRENMYPEEGGDFTLKYPNRFKIEFYNGASINKYMPTIKECYLLSLNTTYNATSNAFHDKGQPVEVDIAVTFQEVKALTRGDLYEEEPEATEEKPEDNG